MIVFHRRLEASKPYCEKFARHIRVGKALTTNEKIETFAIVDF